METQTLSRDAHSGSGHLLPNAAWRLLRALSTLKGPDERILIPGFYDAVLPISDRDKEIFAAFPSEEDSIRKEFAVSDLGGRRLRAAATGEAFKQAVFEPTCNIAGIWSGYQGPGMKTVIPAVATAKLDFRLVPDQDPEDIFGKLRSHLDAQGFSDVKITWLGGNVAVQRHADDPLVVLTARTGEEVYGKPPALVPLQGGKTAVYAFATRWASR